MENIQDTQVRIQLIGDVKGYLDVEKQSVFPLTFSISDIRDISKKKGTFSKSIILAGNKNNNVLLNNYFDINIVAGTFNINKLQYCNVIQNGIPILENALMQLVSINKEQQDSNYEQEVTYTVLIKDSTSDFFSSINNKYLTDLKFDYLNHIYTADNVIDSFGNTVEDGYRYVMPYNPNVVSDNQFALTEFSPGIFAKTYFDKIFSTAGFNYNWTNMTGDTIHFDKLLIPYVGDVINLEKYEDPQYIVDASKISTQSYPNGFYSPPVGYSVIRNFISSEPTANLLNANIINSNPLGLYSNGIYTLPNIPSYTNDVKFEIEIDYEIVVDNNSGVNVYLIGNTSFFPAVESQKLRLKPLLYVNRNGLIENSYNIIQNNDGIYRIDPAATLYPTGTTVLTSGTSIISDVIIGMSLNDTMNLSTKNNMLVTLSNLFNFYTTSSPSSTSVITTSRISLKIKNTRIKFLTQVSGEYGYNSTINMNLFIPQKVKQSDFIKSIFTMYNIYCEVDKDNLNTLNLISRDEYYDNGKIVDWTKKLDKGKEQELKFLPELQNKKLLLTYKEDKDTANESYTKATNEIYGQLEYTFDNEYVKDITKQELIFSPTPMTNTSFGAVCPMWAGGYPNLNMRILYAGSLIQLNSSYTITNYAGATPITGTTYGFNSHWDKPINPTFDINFGVCSYYFMTYNFGSKTNNNLFNLHWRRTLEQINTGKMLTAYFNLNEIDINTLKLSDKIRIDNSWWNINSITDYDANSKSSTKVELISIDEGLFIPFQEKETVIVNDASPLVSLPRNRLGRLTIEQKNTILSTADLPINGINNLIGSQVFNGSINGSNNKLMSNATIIGNDNYVIDNGFIVGNGNQVTSSSVIFGNNNIITTGITNSFIVGDNITATTSNTLYTNNIVISSGGTINNISIENSVSQLEKLTQGANTGYRIYGVDQANYLNIGNKAIDLSFQNSLFGPAGASGNFSFAGGFQSTSSGANSFAFGNRVETSGNNSVSFGDRNVANSDYSFSFGERNSATNDYSFAGGFQSDASGLHSIAIGENTLASGDYSFVIGQETSATNDYSFAGGFQSDASGLHSIAIGQETSATNDYSLATGRGTVATHYGEWARSTNGYPGTGNGQYGFLDFSVTTTDATPGFMYLGGSAPNTFDIEVDSTYRFKVYGLAKDASGNVKEWEGTGLVKNIGGTTTMVGSSIASTFGDVALTTADISFLASDTFDYVFLLAHGIAATTINWYVKIDYIKIS